MIGTLPDVAVKIAWKLYGAPYIYGGNDPDIHGGLDCSGFVRYILRQVGKLPIKGDWTANDLHQLFPVELPQALPGSLAFYGSTNKASHVMLCLSQSLCMGSINGGSWCRSVRVARKKGAKVEVRPILYRGDFLGIRDPFGETR